MSAVQDMLSKQQLRSVQVLATGGSLQAAAAAGGVTTRTLARWRQQAEFQRAMTSTQHEVLVQVSGALTSLCVQAVKTLGEILVDQAAPPAARISAAKVALDLSMRISDARDSRERQYQLNELLPPITAQWDREAY